MDATTGKRLAESLNDLLNSYDPMALDRWVEGARAEFARCSEAERSRFESAVSAVRAAVRGPFVDAAIGPAGRVNVVPPYDSGYARKLSKEMFDLLVPTS